MANQPGNLIVFVATLKATEKKKKKSKFVKVYLPRCGFVAREYGKVEGLYEERGPDVI